MRNLCLALCALALPATAQQDSLTASQFEAYVLGRTFDFGYVGIEPYGLEKYMPDRQVYWSWGDGVCEIGEWYTNGEQICFAYENNPDPQCWYYHLDGGRLRASFVGLDGIVGGEIYELKPVKRDLVCNNFGF